MSEAYNQTIKRNPDFLFIMDPLCISGMDNLLVNKVPVFVHFPCYDKKKGAFKAVKS